MDKVKNTPILRFPEFIEQWKNKRLGEIGEFKNGLNKGKKDFGFGIPFVNLMDVFGKQILIASDFGLVNASTKEIDTYNLMKGDILFIRSSVKRTGVGQTILITKDYHNTVYSGFLIRFRLFYKMELLYKRYCFSVSSFRKELLSFATSSANTNINQESLEKIKVSFPSPKEQTKIAEFLSEVDKKIELLTKKKQGLENYKKGIMQKIFNQEIRFKDDNGNDYPDWEEKKLLNISKFFSGGTPLTTVSHYYSGEIPFIKSGEINLTVTNQKISEDGLNNSSSKTVKKGDLLYALYGATSGEVAISKIDGAINQAVLCIRTTLDNTYLYNLLLFDKEKILSKYLQGGQGNLSADIIKKLEIPVPKIEEQIKIAKLFNEFDVKINYISIQLNEMKQFKKALLQQMFV